MVKSSMRRSLAVALLLVAGLAAQSEPPAYRQTGSVPALVNGNPLTTFAFDAAGRRLYAGSRDGLFWLETDAPKPEWHGPTFRTAVLQVRFAPELRRVFVMTLEAVAYVDVDALNHPHEFAKVRARSIVYEPQRQELYVSYGAPSVTAFNGRTAEPSGTIDIPGWYGILQEAIPGRVFLTLPDKPGLYVINANSHHVGPWPVEGDIVTPAAMEVDPQGRYIFLAYDRNVVAIDTATAKVVGRLTTVSTGSIAYDPGANLLIVMGVTQEPPVHLKAYRVDDTGFTLVATLDNPKSASGTSIEPTNNGFIQRSNYSWLLWSTVTER
jgi:DNA-binding beta-propeller fold protein YncE